MLNSVDPDQMLHFAASDLGLHCLLMPTSQNTKGKYGKIEMRNDAGLVYMSLLTLFKSYRDNGKIIMKCSLQWNTIQS